MTLVTSRIVFGERGGARTGKRRGGLTFGARQPRTLVTRAPDMMSMVALVARD
jgi:hypothetical protein